MTSQTRQSFIDPIQEEEADLLFQDGFDTLEIASAFGVHESVIYNSGSYRRSIVPSRRPPPKAAVTGDELSISPYEGSSPFFIGRVFP